MSHFHSGEVEIQRRLDTRDDAERVGQIIASEIPQQLAPILAIQRLAVAASLDAHRRPWASLLTGPAGFMVAIDEHLLRLAVSPHLDDTLVANLGAHPDLGILAFDPRTRRRLRFNGRGRLAPEGLFLQVHHSPRRREVQSGPSGHIVSVPEVGGLHHRYQRAA
jgi:uncharacterized protein